MRITLDGEPFELTPELIRARLADRVPEDIRAYWVEIDGVRWPVKQVISLATGVTDRQRFQSQSSRRWLQNLRFTIGGGTRATASRPSPPRAAARAIKAPAAPQKADVVLVGCAKTKLAHRAPAKDLYVSDYFSKMRRYAEATGLRWFILSAEHGLVAPDEWLEPYERYLPDTSRDYRRSWGERVACQLEHAVGPLAGVVVDVHAGAAYVDSVDQALRARGALVLDQLQGLSFGRRLSWYLHQESPEGLDRQAVLTQLRDGASAWALGDLFASGGSGLRSPGLYSWWVDEQGAADLTTGLGHTVPPGLIYAGLAGATRSGGSASSNTLWGRIATMHLGGKHEFSTLRRSLGSILASAFEQPTIDEEQLTQWMYAHLRVMTVAVADADSLGDLETSVLTELDPPLNLAKVTTTPLRRQLKALRKMHASRAAGGVEEG